MAIAAACPSALPNGSSSSCANAGSPTAPMPIDASVMPTWQLAMYSSVCSIWWSASTAPLAPSCMSASTLSRRARTSAYSAATKKAFIRTSAGTATRSTAVKLRPSRASYFEEVRRRRSFAAGATLAELSAGPGRFFARSRPRLRQVVDLLRELEVGVRQSALGVRRERAVDRVPRDRQIRVVVHLLRRRGDPVDELDRRLEVLELEPAFDHLAVALPARPLLEPAVRFVVTQNCHRSPCANRKPGALRDRDALRPWTGRFGRGSHPRVRLSATGRRQATSDPQRD